MILTSRERELLLVSARQNCSAEQNKRISELARTATLDWENVIRAAWRHGTLPLLFEHLKNVGCESSIPAPALHLMRQSYVRMAARSHGHTNSLAEVVRRFSEWRVDVLLLKGAAVAQTLYRKPVLRPFADID